MKRGVTYWALAWPPLTGMAAVAASCRRRRRISDRRRRRRSRNWCASPYATASMWRRAYGCTGGNRASSRPSSTAPSTDGSMPIRAAPPPGPSLITAGYAPLRAADVRHDLNGGCVRSDLQGPRGRPRWLRRHRMGRLPTLEQRPGGPGVGSPHESGYQICTALQDPPPLKATRHLDWRAWASRSGQRGRPAHVRQGVTALIQTLIWLPNESEAVL